MTISSEVEVKQVRLIKGTGSQISSARQAGEILDTDLVVQTDAPEPATAEQGALADTAIQPGDNITELTNNAGYQTSSQVNTAIEAKIVDSTSSTSTTSALSANKGKVLQDELNNVKARGRFLSVWSCSTGLPTTNPEESPYPYKAGDYYIVGTVGSGTKYKPNGASFTIGVASTTVETNEVNKDDTYLYDGTSWILQSNTQKSVTFSNLAGSPYDNTNLGNALDSKIDDVKVNGTSVVTNKVANVTVPTQPSDIGAATSAQGSKADSAVQPSDLGSAAYQPTTAFATAAQGVKADGAVRFNLAQSLTDAQKTQARDNIAAGAKTIIREWVG